MRIAIVENEEFSLLCCVQVDGMEDDLAKDDQPRLYIWGTRICVVDVQK